jgi:uncharacterized protein YbjT (DUF2867 family)
MKKIALVIGSTGLVGTQLVKQLLDSPEYDLVKTFTRRTVTINHPKYKNHKVNFDDLESVKDLIQGDDVYSCMGTTLKKAGSIENQYRVDYTYQYNFAKIAKENGATHLLLISSPGAKPNAFYSPYLRIKGELDRDVAKLGYPKLSIFRPSVLAGERDEYRMAENLSIKVINMVKWMPGIAKYRPIFGKEVAQAMINASQLQGGDYALTDLFELSN